MNTAQKTYAIAKALYVTLAEKKAELLKPYDYLLDTENGIEEYTDHEMKFDDELNLELARQALRAAENEMIDWAIAKVTASKDYSPKYAEAVKVCLANRNMPTTHRKLVDLSFTLA